MEDALSLLPFVAIAAIFWFLIIRPASRQRKNTAQLQAALSVGDDVMLTSGIFGTIVTSTDQDLGLEIAPGVVIHVVRGAVASIRADVTEPAGSDHDADRSDDDGTDAVPNDNEER